MHLTDAQIRGFKPTGKTEKLFDGGGLFLLVAPNGGKWWRFKYRFGGKEKLLSLGTYPQTSLKEAREQRDEMKKQMVQGIDPGILRTVRRSCRADDDASFEIIAREWFAKFTPTWAPDHAVTIIRRLEQNIFPWIGKRPVNEITAKELLDVLRRIEARGAIETAHRTNQICGQVFRYAIASGRAERNPSGDLRGALPPTKEKHHAAITEPKAIGELLTAIDGYAGHEVTRCALKLSPYIFLRPGELRTLEWKHVNFEIPEMRFPPEKKDSTIIHIVPLSRQAVAVLQEIFPITGDGTYIFPNGRTKLRPMSENAVLAALRRMGYSKDEMTGHGFRSMASTLLNEMGYHWDAIERQLAHAERNRVRAAYNYADYLPERRKMMQDWANYLDSLRHTKMEG